MHRSTQFLRRIPSRAFVESFFVKIHFAESVEKA